MYNGNIQGIGTIKAGFAFLLIDKDGNQSTSSSYCTFTAEDKDRILVLKYWFENNKSKFITPSSISPTIPPNPGSSVYLRKIEEITPDLIFDLVCQVAKVSPVEGLKSNRVKLLVWDGTTNKIQTGEAISKYPAKFLQIPNYWFGSLLNVIIWNSDYFTLGENPSLVEGKWIKLRNTRSRIYEGILELKIGENSSIVLLKEDDPIVRSRLQF